MLQGLGRALSSELAKREGRGGGDARLLRGVAQARRCSTGGSRPAASRSPRRSTASASAAPSSWRSPAITASLSDDDATRVGLPEIKVGLFPGAGGTQRVARLMQTGDALQMLFKGEQIRAADGPKTWASCTRSRRADEIVEKAKAWIKAGGSAVAPWDEPKFKLPVGQGLFAGRHDDLAAGQRHLPPRDARQLPGRARPSCRRSTRACSCRWTSALKVESRYFAKILRSKEAAAMIRSLFVSMQELNKGARRPPGVPPTQAEEGRRRRRRLHGRRHRLCHGAMPASTSCSSTATMEAAEKGKAYSHKLITDQIMKGRAKTADRDALLARITPTRRLRRPRGLRPRRRGGVRGPEGQGRGDRARSRPRSGPTAIFASNTSTLPITGLAKALAAAGRSSSASISSRRSRR